MTIALAPARAERSGTHTLAFSLLEVMIAVAIFFTCIFVLLQLTTMSLDSARKLQRYEPDASMLAAQLAMTNVLTEDHATGDFGDAYPGYTWTRDVYQPGSNNLWEADFKVEANHGKVAVSTMSIYLFRPQSPKVTVEGALPDPVGDDGNPAELAP